jgi:hypothetical protein
MAKHWSLKGKRLYKLALPHGYLHTQERNRPRAPDTKLYEEQECSRENDHVTFPTGESNPKFSVNRQLLYSAFTVHKKYLKNV